MITILSNQEIQERFKKKGIQASMQRIRIYDYLQKSRMHPSVETIYHDLIAEIPTLSKTTVYNTLDEFADKGIISNVLIEDHEIRVDADISPHGHFKCLKCGKIFDFKVDFPKLDNPELTDFFVKEKHFYLKGICSTCKNDKTK